MGQGTGTETVASSPLATSSPLVHGPKAQAARQARLEQHREDVPAGWRRAGMLLHVTSLPGPDGIGDLGATSRAFVDWLARAGQRLWQVLPLHPPANAVMSPYDAASAFAGNPLLVSLDDLMAIGLLPDTLPAIRRSVGVGEQGAAAQRMVAGRPGGIDPLARVARWKLPLVRQAARQLLSLPSGHELRREFQSFCEREAWWLADHVAFTALREQHPGVPREEWPVEDRVRKIGAHRARSLDIGATHQHPEAAVQFLFDRQLRALHAHARTRDVWIMGDAPIYVGDDSADVWAHPELFLLDEVHRAKVRTGAPPDAMDPTGQVWPMPAYDWPANAAADWEWWIRRLRREFDAADVVRIDHFRAFADWWCVPPQAAYAEQGRWEPGPGKAFFDALTKAFGGQLELVVEDLGMETEPLQRLRRETGLPQMRVLVQGFDEGGASLHLPTAWTGNEAAYTDTHDYDTVRGWGERADADALAFALRFTGASDARELPRAAIETVLGSNARFAIAPLQDWLGLGSDARMNVPGTAHGNWRWLAPADAFTDALADELAGAAARTGRGAARA
jgi:4-alpha-glucanotransferase